MSHKLAQSLNEEEIGAFQVEKITIGDFTFKDPASHKREETGVTAVP